MTKHNNEVPSHFKRKKWGRRVKTNFDAPMKAQKRRLARERKAAAIFPRPLELLRPAVRISTIASNNRQRLGRGFSVEEIKKAGLTVAFARTVGITVDTRRRNLSEEALQQNIQRLNEYKAKLVLFPRQAGKTKKGPIADSAEEALKNVQQLQGNVLPIATTVSQSEPREITAAERKKSAHKTLRHARRTVKAVGYLVKKKRAAEEAANATGGRKSDDAE
jgi:large subunit ribosomal protein L13e